MKSLKIFLVLVLFAYSLTGCIYHDIKTPIVTNKGTWYQMNTDDFKIVGVAEAEGSISQILFGAAAWGGNGLREIEKKTIELGGDDFMNFIIDYESTNYLFIYTSIRWKAHATVIKYTDKAKVKK